MDTARSSVFVELEVGDDGLPLDNEANRARIKEVEDQNGLVLETQS